PYLFVLVFVLVSYSSKAQYCSPTSSCSIDYIDSFSTTNGITNIANHNTGCSAGGYVNYSTSHIHTTTAGTQVNFSVTTDGDDEATDIWVDFNQNSIFDATEKVYTGVVVPPGTRVTGSFNVPLTAISGMTRLRVRCNYFGPPPGPCPNSTWGETEDYGFMIISPTPCSGTPSAGNIVLDNNELKLQGTSLVADLAFQWQKKEFCPGSLWQNIPGATSRTLTPSNPPGDYRCIVTCTNSGQSDTTNPLYI